MSKRWLVIAPILVALAILWIEGRRGDGSAPLPETNGPESSSPGEELIAPGPGHRSARESPAGASASGEVITYSIVPQGQRRPSSRTISGRLVFSDGAPARGRVLVLLQDVGASGRTARASARDEALCDSRGRFVTTDLDEGLYTLEASGYRSDGLSFLDVTWRPAFAIETPEDRAIADMTLSQVLALPQPEVGRTVLRDVRPGTGEIELTLERGLVVRGVVRDDLGDPVDDFLVIARPGRIERRLEAIGDFVGLALDGLARRIEASDGRFEVSGLYAGPWTLLIWSDGLGVAAPQEVMLPRDDELVFDLPRGGRVEGVVLDPRGTGVPAELVLQQVPAIGSYDNADWQEEGIPTAADGTFSLSAIHGTLHLYARSKFGASSPVAILPIEPGVVLSGVRIDLQVGGRIEALLLDEEDRPLAESQIGIFGFGTSAILTTDEQGLASLENLAEGDYSVSFSDEWGGGSRFCEEQARLAEGESRRVVLRVPRVQPVQLSGRITSGREPIAHATLQFSCESFGDENSWTNEDGRYSVRLPSPGTYELDIEEWVPGKEPGRVRVVTIGEMKVEVPAVATFSHDVLLELGRITGRVRGPEGTPLPGIPVRVISEESPFRFTSSVETDSAGLYQIRVPADEYMVVAGDRDNFDDPPEGLAFLATATTPGVAVHPEETVVIDFDLVAGGAVTGIVRRIDGRSVDSALVTILVGGTTVPGLTDASGRYCIRGVLPGRGSVSAEGLGEDLVSSEEPSVDVEAGRTASVDLELVRATEVELLAVDAKEVPIEARFEVLSHAHPSRAFDLVQRGPASFVSLPDGTYTVRMLLPSGTIETELEIDGENKKLLRIPIE